MSKPNVVRLGDVIESMKNGLYKPADAYADDGVACLRMYNIDQGKIVWRDVKRMLLTQQDLNDYRLLPGDLLVNRVNTRELVGKSAVIPEWQEPVVFESKNIRVRLSPNRALPKFINYQLLLRGSQYFSDNAQQVVGMASVNQKQLSDFPILLPSLNAQEKIVTEIDTQFSRLDEAANALKRVQTNLKRNKAAILKAAVEGKLTEQWREEHQDIEPADQLLKHILAERRALWEALELARIKNKGIKPKDDSWKKKYKEPTEPDISNVPKLPEGWVWATLGQLAWSVKDGPHYSPQYSTSGIPFISGGNIRAEGIDFSAAKFITPELHAELSQRCKPEYGDLLYTKGGTTGIARINTETQDFNVWVHVAVLKLVSSIDPFYLQHALNSPYCYRQSQKHTHGVGNQDLGLTRMIWITVPLPTLPEQKVIVEEIDRFNSTGEKLETIIRVNLQRTERLRQTILKQALDKVMPTVTDSSANNRKHK